MQSLEMMQLYILDVLKAETFPADKSMCEEVISFSLFDVVCFSYPDWTLRPPPH